MLCKKSGLFWKSSLAAVSITMALGVSGCDALSPEEVEIAAEEDAAHSEEEQTDDDADEIADICLDIHKKAASENKLADLETVRSIVNRLGEYGYAAVDSDNQVDMTMAEQAAGFCGAVSEKETAETAIYQVDYFGGIVKYDLQTEGGSVEVTRSYYAYEDGTIHRKAVESYQAENWTYTEEGYLMFSGAYYSEEMYALTLSSAKEHVALRVEPLDEKYRELNRKYLLPVGYTCNNLFITDWNESDFGDLDFYDLFDIFYSQLYENYFPYEADESLGGSDVFRIPREDFEQVIRTHFNIDSETLQSKTVYHQEDSTYEYKPRRAEEAEYPAYPFSEVTGFSENEDGTITLMVRAVFPYIENSSAYFHEVTVRPLENGGFQYVSNRSLTSEDDGRITWHKPRLTADEWEERYGGNRGKGPDAETPGDSAYWPIPQSDDCLISGKEQQEIRENVLKAARSVGEIYKGAAVFEAPKYSSGVAEFTDEQRKAVVEQLGSVGVASVAEDTNMQNPGQIETFYGEYQKGQNAMVTVYDVQQDGLIGAMTFIHRDHKLQMYYVGIRWKEGGVPEIQGISISDVAEIKLTGKGYFIYAYEYVIPHASLRQYWRIKPLPDKCRELTEKYISGLSYVDHNLLVTNWDAGNVEDILMPCMYEDIYRIATGQNLKAKDGKIPSDEYERIMTLYFPVSKEQLRENCGYDTTTDSYKYEMLYPRSYAPFGEVTDFTENADGTITLIVDGVWPDRNSDLAFRNVIVVQPFADGTFRYLSNSIEKMELDIPVVRRD